MNTVSNEIIKAVESINLRYYKLVIVVGDVDYDKESILSDLSNNFKYPVINVNLELSSRLIDLSVKQRALKVSEIMAEIANIGLDGVILDRTEILFDTSLQLAPLGLLKSLSRDKIIITMWSGSLSNGRLYYAEPSHPEYKSYSVDDVIVIDVKELIATEL
jgi:hypothetical protein